MRKVAKLSKDKVFQLRRNHLMLIGRDILGMSLGEIKEVFNCSSRQVVFEAIKNITNKK